MDILSRFGASHVLTSSSRPHSSVISSSSSSSSSILKPFCSRRNSSSPQPQNNDDDNGGDRKGENMSTDWDKAWANFRKQGKRKNKKKTVFSEFSPNKYVTWNPRRSNYPISEEVDPIKRTERSNLMLWTSPEFTLGLAIILVTFLLIYTILAPVK